MLTVIGVIINMLTWEKHMEFRRHLRFKAPGDVHVKIGTQSDKYPGFLVNISRGGVSIEYIPYKGQLKPDRPVDVIFKDRNLGVMSLPGKTVFDIEVVEKYYTPIKFRKLGVQFQQLTTQQQVELENCIKTIQMS